MKINLDNRQSKLTIHRPALLRLVRWITGKLRASTAVGGRSEITLLLTDNAGITRTNLRVFEKNDPTDVITVLYTPAGAMAGPTGEIVVNAERALMEGARRGGLEHELALYIAHGLDHLNGASDHTPAQRAAMRRRELGWLREAGKRGLLNRICQPAAE